MVFGVLTDGQGEMPIAVRIERLDTLEIVKEQLGTMRCNDPLADTRLRLPVRAVSFPVSGWYQVILLVDREIIAARRFEIVHVPAEEFP